MSRSFSVRAVLGVVAASALLASGAARADRVYWSVGIDSPQSGVSTRMTNMPPPRVVHAPPMVMYSPAPVVYAPPPVVYAPQPVYAVPAQPVVVVRDGWGRGPHHHHHWDRRAYPHGWGRRGGWDRWDD